MVLPFPLRAVPVPCFPRTALHPTGGGFNLTRPCSGSGAPGAAGAVQTSARPWEGQGRGISNQNSSLEMGLGPSAPKTPLWVVLVAGHHSQACSSCPECLGNLPGILLIQEKQMLPIHCKASSSCSSHSLSLPFPSYVASIPPLSFLP